MKIESIQAFPMRISTEEDLRGGTFSYANYQTVLVSAVADGVEGWGEAMSRSDPDATALLVRYMGKGLVGKEFNDPKSAWQGVWRELRVRGHTRGVDVEALSGIEIALQDCLGKTLRKPFCKILSASAASHVPVFAGSLFASRGAMKAQVERARGRGLGGAKVKIGFGVEKDRETLRYVRNLWPDGMIVADANGAYDAEEAAKACSAFDDLGLAWFEEPVLSDDLSGYKALKNSKVKIGAGESWFPGDFDTPIDEKLIGVLEPSVSRCGGIGVEAEVAKRAIGRGIQFSPMTGMNSIVSLAASLHVSAACPSLGVEFNPFDNPLQTELATGVEEPHGGLVGVPSGDGLGVEIDMRFVKSHSV